MRGDQESKPVISDSDLKGDEDNGLTQTDIVDREVGEDFYGIYNVKNCSV